jgi:ParB family chromosome partitioning protein
MRRALGKGLSQLITESTDGPTTEVAIDQITPNPRQPRTHFDETALNELAESIRLHGVLQPLIVRPLGQGRYELIAGERRWRAAQRAGLRQVPVVVRATDPKGSLEIALIENIQRADIGALESARAYRQLMDEFGLTQEQVAERVGKSRTAVANTVRLLRLPPRVLAALESGEITEGHARPLLTLDSPAAQLALFDKMTSEAMTSKDVERAVRPAVGAKPRPRKPGVVDATDPNWRALQQAASERLGSPVKLEGSEKGGTITVRFFSEEDLVRIMEVLGVEL